MDNGKSSTDGAEASQPETALIDLNDDALASSSQLPAENEECPPQLVKTSCGDSHNIGLDVNGLAYNLPSPLDFDVFPSNVKHKARK